MEIKNLIHPSTNFEIIKYYWPESLSGQANSAAGPFGQMSDMHYRYTRECGTKTCSCGLVYWDSNLPLDSNPWRLSIDDFGHRNHQTGEFEAYHKSLVNKFGSPTEKIFECEWCQTTSILDGFFDESNDHRCELENPSESRFVWTVTRMHLQSKKFFIKLFEERLESLDFGCLETKLGLEGASVFSRSPYFRTAVSELLDDGSLLLSEEIRQGEDEVTDWPSDYVNPTEQEMDLFWEAEKENHNRYLMDNPEDFGYFKFWKLPVESHNLVRYTVTKETFTINAPRSNVPLMRLPVIWLA